MVSGFAMLPQTQRGCVFTTIRGALLMSTRHFCSAPLDRSQVPKFRAIRASGK